VTGGIRKEIQMRKISLIAIAAVLILIGVGVEAGAWSKPTNRVLTANPVVDPSGPTSGKDMPTALVFPAVIGQ
jgi:hypothetical protein